ncbi:MAG: TIGR03936 family radical SAM-associated protein [Synechococcus sp. H1_metabat_bins_2.tsv.006]|nr:TIGR03936 family radical SAM-associated protein [Synechococcus sp. H1_metabat_bins_2.tsv.006]
MTAFAELVNAGISRPGRYLGNELGVEPRDWGAATIRWALTYPEVYEVGASNLGHIILYSILNAQPRQLCDRAYLPAPDLAERLRSTGSPLFAVESRRPLNSFDILGFSLSYELSATNVLEMLDLIGLPLYARDRGDAPLGSQDALPLIFAGGQTATSNPEPYAPFFDFIALGDGEELLPEIGLVLEEGKAAGLPRSALLRDLAEVPGVYVPALGHRRVVRRVATPMPHYAMGLVPHVETVHDRLTVEIRRGCTRGCRFCQPGMLTRPARDVDPEEVVEAVETGMVRTGYSDFSLLSLSCSDYLALPAVGVELRNRLQDHNVSLSLPSQRIDRFDNNIAHILGGTRQGGLTFAPEAGTQRMRDIVNKGLTDQELSAGIETAMRNGWRKVKLYFMIGLPGETDADVHGIADTVERLRFEMRDIGRLELNLTISNFTPKPHTPFQWHSVSTAEFKRRQGILRQRFGGMRFLKVNYTDVRLSAMEDFIGRGDQRLAPVIEAAWRSGAGMDAWFDNIERTHGAWCEAIEAAGLGGRYRELELGSWAELQALTPEQRRQRCAEPLPWDHIDSGVSKQWLQEDLERALEAVVVPDCSFDGCSHCGVCGEGLGHNVVVPPPPIPTIDPPRKPPSEQVGRLRVRFAKTGEMALLSHLDLVRMLERALRRSQLPVSFTGGFHPLPRLQLALALPLGAEADSDWLDLSFTEVVQPEQLMDRLAPLLPQGFALLEAHGVPVKSPALSQMLQSAHWRLCLEPSGADRLPAERRCQEALGELLGAEALPLEELDRQGRRRRRDLRPLLLDLHWHHWSPQRLELGLETLVQANGRSLKPDQLRQLLAQRLGCELQQTQLRRVALKLAC